MLLLLALSLLFMVLTPLRCSACMTVIAGKHRTQRGGILHAHVEDMGTEAVGTVWRTQAGTHAPDAMVTVPYAEIPVPEKTFAYWASGNAADAEGLGISAGGMPYNNVLVGFNENNVSMSCNWCYSKEKNCPESGLRRYALRQLLLEQAKSARHGVELLGKWIDRYGQADWGGLQFQISDKDEAWVVETTSTHWAGRKISDDEIYVVANRFMLGEEVERGSPDLVSFAIEHGWHDQTTPFHFADAYSLAHRRSSPYDTDREQRIRTLLSDKDEKIDALDLLEIFQDRYEGTELFVIPDDSIQIWEEEAEKNSRPRPICTNLCQSFFVATHDSTTTENEFVFFIGLGTPGYSGIVPLYTESTHICTAYYSEERDAPLAWKIFREIQHRTDKNFLRLSGTVKELWRHYNLMVLQKASKVKGVDKNDFTLKTSCENISYAKTVIEKYLQFNSHTMNGQ